MIFPLKTINTRWVHTILKPTPKKISRAGLQKKEIALRYKYNEINMKSNLDENTSFFPFFLANLVEIHLQV